MISWIKGEIVSSWHTNNKFFILINCQGLGYEIQTLESTHINLNAKKISDKACILWLKHIKKEDSDLLFGFLSRDQRDFFIEILNIKGIGSQIGMALLNKYSLDEIINAIIENDKKLISSVQGIGQKMTERLILELKSKLHTKQNKNESFDKSNFLNLNIEIKTILEDINLTLQSLNYPKSEIKTVFPILINEIKKRKLSTQKKLNNSFENLLKVAMNHLDTNNRKVDQ